MKEVPDPQVRLPRPRPWSEPVTEEQLRAFAPEGLELVDGYLPVAPKTASADGISSRCS